MSKYLRYHICVRVLLIALAGVPAAVMALNFIIDPFSRYHQLISNESLARLKDNDGAWLKVPANYDDRLFVKKVLKTRGEAEIFLLGGSRVLKISGAMMNPIVEGKFLNLGLTAATVYDYIALWQLIKENTYNPKVVIIGLALQDINTNAINDRWRSLQDAYYRFVGEKPGGFFWVQRLTGLVRELLAFETSMSTLKTMNKDRDTYEVVNINDIDQSESYRSSSLMLLNPLDFSPDNKESILKLGLANGVGEVRDLNNWNHTDMTSIKLLEDLFRDMNAHGVKPILVLMPYHPRSYSVIRDHKSAFLSLERVVKQLKDVASREEVAFYDGLFQADREIQDIDFQDGVHLNIRASYDFFKAAISANEVDIFDSSYPYSINDY